MFSLVIFAFTLLTPFANAEHGLKDKTDVLAKMCSEKVGLSKELVLKLKDANILPENETEKCYLECLYEGIGIVKDGRMDPAGANAAASLKFGDNKEMLEKAQSTINYCLKNDVAHPEDKCFYGLGIRDCVTKAGYGITLF